MLESFDSKYPVYTVSQLNQKARALLEHALPYIWIEGEISNLRAPGSGHFYFSLKDKHAQVRCALFRNRLQLKNILPKDGMHVLARATVSLYEERGDFQLIIEKIEEIGDGALRRAFEMLKNRLAEEGLFDKSHKKEWDKQPTCIGVITSPTGAAIRDILSVLQRRASFISIIIYPTQVQGNQAADQIVQAIHDANLRQECDILLLARGGGSLEDLWPFNEEKVARAVYHSTIPVVTGIGHETDFTIADFVADCRAPTPSAAAELISPNIPEWLETFRRLQTRLTQTITQTLKHAGLVLYHLEKRLPHPQKQLQNQIQKLDGFMLRLQLAQKHLQHGNLTELQQAIMQLKRHAPLHRLQAELAYCLNLQQRLNNCAQHQLHQTRERLNHYMQALDSISPLNTLNRGYAIVTHQGKILLDSVEVTTKDQICVRLAKGKLTCSVENI